MENCNVNQDFHLNKHKQRPHIFMRSLLFSEIKKCYIPSGTLKDIACD